MKNIILISIAFILSLSLCSSGCSNEETEVLGKYTSEEVIFNEIKKGYDGIQKEDVCIDEIKSFKTLFIVGFFAYDRGCDDSQYFYKGDSIQLTDVNIRNILIDNGFKNNKTKVVEAYNIEVVNHLNSVLTTAPDTFDTVAYEFHAPKTWEENDQIISNVWVKTPGGMIPQDSYYLSEFIVDKDGKVKAFRKKNKYSVSYK